MEILNCTIDEYHARPEVSSGMIRCFRVEGPWTCKAKYVDRILPNPDTKERRLGRAFHTAMEKPDTWRDCMAILPEAVPWEFGELKDTEKKKWRDNPAAPPKLNLQYDRHKAYVADFTLKAQAQQKEVLTVQEAVMVVSMIKSVYDNPGCLPYVGKGQAEAPAISKDERNSGLAIKALADVWHAKQRIVVDFKTTRHGTLYDFTRDAYGKGYHFQLSHYLQVFEAERAIIIAVRNYEPFESMCFEVPPARLQEGLEGNAEVLRNMAQCFEYDEWHTLGWGQVNQLEFEGLLAQPGFEMEDAT